MGEKKKEETKEKPEIKKKTEVFKEPKPKSSKEIKAELKTEIKPKVEINFKLSEQKEETKVKSNISKEEAKPKVEIKIPAAEKKKEPKTEIISKLAESKKEIKFPTAPVFKMFGVWDTREVQVLDQGMRRYISLKPVYLPCTQGRSIAKQFWKSKKPVIERLINKLLGSGHKGKKHWRSSGQRGGKKLLGMKLVIDAFKIIEQKTKRNPVEVLVRAIETGAPREGIITIEYGGVRYPKAVDLSPQRRIDLALRWLTQGAYQSAAAGNNVKKKMSMALAEQIMLTAESNNQSFCVSKKVDLERQAAASR